MRSISVSGAARGRQVATALALASCLALTGCLDSTDTEETSADGTVSDMEPMTLKLNSASGPGSPHALGMEAFAAEVEEKSGGKITAELFTSSSLVPLDGILEGLEGGVADVGFLSLGYFPQELPGVNWLGGIAAMPESTYPFGVLQGLGAAMEFVGNEQFVKEEANKVGVHFAINYFAPAPSDMLCTKPVDSLKDMKGLRVRISNTANAADVEALGGVPVQMSYDEMYEALQRGAIDCIVLFATTWVDTGLWEFAKHYVPARFTGLNNVGFGMSLKTWNALPPDAQTIVRDAMITLIETVIREDIKGYQRFASGAEEQQVVIHDPSELDEVLRAHQEEILAQLPSAAPAIVEDPQGTIDRYLGLLGKWLGIVEETVPELELLDQRTPDAILQSYLAAGEADLDPFFARLRKELGSE